MKKRPRSDYEQCNNATTILLNFRIIFTVEISLEIFR